MAVACLEEAEQADENEEDNGVDNVIYEGEDSEEENEFEDDQCLQIIEDHPQLIERELSDDTQVVDVDDIKDFDFEQPDESHDAAYAVLSGANLEALLKFQRFIRDEISTRYGVKPVEEAKAEKEDTVKEKPKGKEHKGKLMESGSEETGSEGKKEVKGTFKEFAMNIHMIALLCAFTFPTPTAKAFRPSITKTLAHTAPHLYY